MDADASSVPPSSLGIALRSIRRERGLSLAAVSKMTGLPVATLSKVENGKRSLTYDKLLQLSKGLAVEVAQLFSGHVDENESPAMVPGRRSVARSNDGFVVDAGVYTYTYIAQELTKKRFLPTVMDLHARSLDEFETLLRHDGDELAFVLEGEVMVHTDIYEPLRLKKGESVYFDSRTGHAYVNAGEGTARILCIASTAEPPRTNVEFPRPKRAALPPAAGSPQPVASRGPKAVNASKRVKRRG